MRPSASVTSPLPYLAAAVLAATPARGQQAAPSFDCARAAGAVETLICRDAELAAIDRRMAAVYAAAMQRWPANIAAEQRALQRGWVKGRNDCWKADDVRECARTSYRTRIVELQIQSGQLVAPTPVEYACVGGADEPFVAAFYSQTEPSSVVLTYGDGQVIAFAAPSASGSRYAARDVEFSERAGEATVDWFGTAMTCRRRPDARAVQEPRAGLDGTTWRLVRFESMDDTTLEPGADARYGLTFGDGGRLVVQSDCNRGEGSWRSNDDVSLEIGPIVLTRAVCRPSALQDRFVRDLGYVRSYVVRDGKLYLSLMADGGIYAFEPELPDGSGGATR